MTYYSTEPYDCRVDIFKESGTWYETIVVKFKDENWKSIRDDGSYSSTREAFKKALYEKIEGHFEDCYAVCLEPYHQDAHPLMIKIT